MKFAPFIMIALTGLSLVSCDRGDAKGEPIGVEAVALDSKQFVAEVENGTGLAMVDFWAEWCEPCKVVSKHVQSIATDYEGQLLVAKVDVDIASDVATRQQVKSLPSVFFYRDGEKVGEVIGLATREKLEAQVENLLSSTP